MSTLHKSLPLASLIIIMVCIVTAPVLAAASKTVAGTIVDIYNDEEAGAAYVTISTTNGIFIIDCKHKSFDTPIAPKDFVKVTVNHVRSLNNKPVGDLVAVLQHTPSTQ
jgi:hypothetical protein